MYAHRPHKEDGGGEGQQEMLSGMIDHSRLRDISDLPFELAIRFSLNEIAIVKTTA